MELNKVKKYYQGFSLIELLIVMVIVAILSGLLLPIYINFLNKAKYSEVVHVTASYKVGVEACVQVTSDLLQCSSGVNAVPPAYTSPSSTAGYIATVIATNGVITATSQQIDVGGATTFSYILTPTLSSGNHVMWATSGTCQAAGLC